MAVFIITSIFRSGNFSYFPTPHFAEVPASGPGSFGELVPVRCCLCHWQSSRRLSHAFNPPEGCSQPSDRHLVEILRNFTF
jgi:hypothetical protein